MTTDYYEVLGVSTSASDDEIKKAYRQLARQHHPDASDDPEAAARFNEIQTAYDTLRDPERRRRYDMFGPETAGAGMGGGNPFDAGAFGLNDLFDAFFGGEAFGGRGPSGPARGPDAETVMELSLSEVVFGVTKSLELRMPVVCTTCDGNGCAPGTHPTNCTTCGGTGEVRQVRRSLLGQIVTAAPCATCSGLGTIVPSPCDTCRGEGRVHGERKLDVDVPAGIDDGQRLRLAGKGPAAPRGGVAGDLYVLAHVARHPDFERHGEDLVHRRKVSMVQAALGTQLAIETLDGEQIVDVEAGTQHGAVFRKRGLGVPSLRSGRRGDLLIEVDVEIPRHLSAEEAELLAQFAELRGEDVGSSREGGLFSRLRSAFRE